MTSGEPATLRYSPAASSRCQGFNRISAARTPTGPKQNGDPYGDRDSVTAYLSRDTVTAPTDPSQPFGNAERNSVRGPWFWQMDLVAAKDFPLPIGPQTRIQVRLEAFNLLNKVNFRAPNANRSAADYGTITSTFDARQLQLGIKLMF